MSEPAPMQATLPQQAATDTVAPSAATGHAPLRRVVYVVSQFPCLHETFIAREIATLVSEGVDVRILSLKAPSPHPIQRESAPLLDRVRHPHLLGTILGSLAVTVREPRQVLGSLATIVADSWRHPVVAVKSLVSVLRGLEHVAWLRRFDPQLIHAHWATYPTTVAWVLGRVLHRPFSFTCHAHDIFIERQMLARKIDDSALAVTMSHFNVDWLSSHATPRASEKLNVVHCGVDLDRNAWQPHNRSTATLLAVGRLDPIKGFATLIDALRLLRERGAHLHCRLIGSGPLDDELRQFAHDCGVADMIDFAGAQTQDVVRGSMNSATLFVLPSEVADDGNRDGIPVALMEAMASGCPVISTRVSGIPELIEDNRDGLLVPERDPEALADAIQQLLAEPELRARLAARARARIEHAFDARKEASRLHGYMAEVVHGR